MAVIEVEVCDVCRKLGEPTRTYTLGRDGEDPVEKALCARHGAPFDAILDGEAPAPTRRSTPARAPAETTPRRRRRSTPILTLAEIEERKAGENT